MNRIEELRSMRKMTQYEFADFCGVSRSSIARYEAGGMISRASAEAIGKACDVSVDYVLGRDDPSAAPPSAEDDVWKIREQLRRDPDMRVLFSAASKATPEHIRAAAAMLKALRTGENNDAD